jgi:hypothetical protein
MSLLEIQQILAAMIHSYVINDDENIDDVFENVRHGEVTIFDMKIDNEYYEWVSAYANEAEVGVIFNADTVEFAADVKH